MSRASDHPGWRSRIDDAELVLTNPQMIWVHAQEGLDFWRFLKDRAACCIPVSHPAGVKKVCCEHEKKQYNEPF